MTQMAQSRRRFLAALTAAGGAGLSPAPQARLAKKRPRKRQPFDFRRSQALVSHPSI